MAVLARVLEARLSLVLLFLSVLVFGYEVSLGNANAVPVLLGAGALDRSHVLAGEWWRLGSAMFVHVGLLHLLVYVSGCFGCCVVVEHDLGKARFVLVYLASGIAGAAASVIVDERVSAGASGVCCGMIAAMLILRQRELGSWGALFRDTFARLVLATVALGFGITSPFIVMDHGAHAGGFVAGAMLTWALTASAFRVRGTILALAAIAMLVFAAVRPWWKPREAPEFFAYAYLSGEVSDDTGTTYPIHYARARRFAQRACDQGGALGCEYLVRIYQEGLGTPKDDATVLHILDRSCERGDSQACYEQGAMLAKDPAATQAIDLFEKACTSPRQRVWAACVSLAEYYRVGRGRPKDLTHARALVQEACDVGYEDGCAGTIFIDAWIAPPGPGRDAGIEKLRAMCKEEGSWSCRCLHTAEKWPG
ncbi:rhomboid family intramembrane serine protease [Pendulispora brunnea]|uniref:Rhomboid family intramembrane serine protease n=1 Tax=Pendulispora brunnea TaxID=2905690 RepID=A0ABZ2KHD8_9BACT